VEKMHGSTLILSTNVEAVMPWMVRPQESAAHIPHMSDESRYAQLTQEEEHSVPAEVS
jgi:hypothetical protein